MAVCKNSFSFLDITGADNKGTMVINIDIWKKKKKKNMVGHTKLLIPAEECISILPSKLHLRFC